MVVKANGQSCQAAATYLFTRLCEVLLPCTEALVQLGEVGSLVNEPRCPSQPVEQIHTKAGDEKQGRIGSISIASANG